MLISIWTWFLVGVLVAQETAPKPPNIYRWLEQNSYLCDPSLTNKQTPKFLTFSESRRIKCSCGDPLKSKSACARKSRRQKPICLRLPDTCMKEYVVIFANIGSRQKPMITTGKINHHKVLLTKHRKPISAKLRIHF